MSRPEHSPRVTTAELRVRLGSQEGLIDVTYQGSVVAEVADPTSASGPAVRVAGTDHPPVVTN